MGALAGFRYREINPNAVRQALVREEDLR